MFVDVLYSSNNTTYDPNKSLTYHYNYLNLPYRIVGGENDELQMLYSADGTLFQRKYKENSATIYTKDYLRSKEYRNGILESIYHNDGRVTKDESGYHYEYHIKDHLGNIRVTFVDDNNDGLIVGNERRSLHDYYAFGLEWNGNWKKVESSGATPMRYNGKEMVGDMNLKQLQFGFRALDPAIGRWINIDVLSEKYPDLNPFNFVGNNPINAIDIKGDSITPVANILAGNDRQGYIKTATPEQRENSPATAAIIDGTHAILTMHGINLLDDLFFGTAPVAERVTEAAGMILTPVPGKGLKPGTKNLKKTQKSTTNSVDYIVTPKGETIKIPDGSKGPSKPNKGSEMVFQDGSGGKGMDKRTTSVRIMDANSNQRRRVNYMNTKGQTVDPITGRVISNKDPRGHLKLKDY